MASSATLLPGPGTALLGLPRPAAAPPTQDARPWLTVSQGPFADPVSNPVLFRLQMELSFPRAVAPLRRADMNTIVAVIRWVDDERTLPADYVVATDVGTFEARCHSEASGPPLYEKVLGTFGDVNSACAAIHRHIDRSQSMNDWR